MTDSKITCLGLLMLFTCVLPVYSATFTDEFNDSVLDHNVWMTNICGVNGEVSVRNQRLEYIIPQEAIPTPYTLQESLSCQSLFKLRGDFDVQVDYSLFNGSHFDNGGIGLTTLYGGVWRYNSGIGADVYDFAFETQSTVDTRGTLRLVRIGNTATAYCYSAGNWVSLGSSVYTTSDVNIVLAYHNYADKRIGSPVYLALDNFTVNEGQIVNPVPEPSAFTVLACGLAGILSRTRKRRSS